MGVIGPAPSVERIDLANEPDFDLGSMRVKPSERAVVVGGERRELQPRVMQVLIALAQARPTVVSRDKLIEQCWDGRIVGDDALNRVVLALRHLAQEFTPQPFTIDTVPRVGHRLLVDGHVEDLTSASLPKSAGKARPIQFLGVVFALLLILAAGLFAWQRYSAEPDPVRIAVLPFKDLSGVEPYLAGGIGDEILARLAREPAFQVAGSASSAGFAAGSDPREVGRALGVDYLLEGSVRPGSGRVRVNASLVKTSDGMRLWSDSYDRSLDDILEIQGAIGEAVAAGLSRRLVDAGGPRAINGETYAFYLNARGLLRSRNPEAGQEAVALLERVTRLDPTFAPAWSSLAEALDLNAKTQDAEAMIAALPRATAAARRALQLDPNLAHGHNILGKLIGNETPQAAAHFRRAGELAGRSGEGLYWRATALEVSGHREQAVAVYRQAHEADPAWPIPVRTLVDLYTLSGDRADAESLIASQIPDEQTRQFALARVAWWSGDFSDAARRWAALAKEPSGRWTSQATLSLEDMKLVLGISDKLPSRPPRPMVGSFRFGPRVWMTAAPTAAQWRALNRSAAAALVHYDEAVVAAKLMLNAGRFAELVATYDGATGLLGIRRGEPIGSCQLDEAALVALALRGAGRTGEADDLLRRADAVIRTGYRNGKNPAWFDEDAAGIWAVQGKAGPAAEALGRALSRGWAHGGRTDLPTIEEEPMFRPVRNDRRIAAALARYKAHYARERAETARALGISA